MRSFLSFLCVFALCLAFASDAQAQLRGRRGGGCSTGGGCGVSSGCGVSQGCGVQSSGCNVSAAPRVNRARPVDLLQTPPLTLPPAANDQTAKAKAIKMDAAKVAKKSRYSDAKVAAFLSPVREPVMSPGVKVFLAAK